jgi:hypothetical protein
VEISLLKVAARGFRPVKNNSEKSRMLDTHHAPIGKPYFSESSSISASLPSRNLSTAARNSAVLSKHFLGLDGLVEGELDGPTEGEVDVDGLVEGELDGLTEGEVDGLVEGELDGLVEGEVDGLVEGELDGLVEGDGLTEGEVDGLVEGELDGLVEGELDGLTEGEVDGMIPQPQASFMAEVPHAIWQSGVMHSKSWSHCVLHSGLTHPQQASVFSSVTHES